MTERVTVSIETARIADQLERAFRGGAWHGPAVTESLAGVDATAAARRPIPGAHTIGEIAAHLAVWMEVASRRLAGEAARDLPEEEDWPRDAAASEEAWRATRERLEAAHRALHGAVLALEDERLDDAVAGSDPTVRGLLLGVLQHSSYHAAQIVLLRKALAAGGGAA